MKSPKSPSSRPPSCDELIVVIDPAGNLQFIHHDDLRELLEPAFPDLTTRRASNVEPCPDGWAVDISPLTGGAKDVIAVAKRRDDALAAEVDWLQNHLEGASLESENTLVAVPRLSILDHG